MDREKAIDEAKFSSGELREALVERHSEETQQKLEQGRVAIAGLGGLGSNVAIALTRIGVGHLHLLDFDPGGSDQPESSAVFSGSGGTV